MDIQAVKGTRDFYPEDMAKLTQAELREKIVKKLRGLGFKFVTLDMAGFRSGSLNELLTQAEKKRYSDID